MDQFLFFIIKLFFKAFFFIISSDRIQISKLYSDPFPSQDPDPDPRFNDPDPQHRPDTTNEMKILEEIYLTDPIRELDATTVCPKSLVQFS